MSLDNDSLPKMLQQHLETELTFGITDVIPAKAGINTSTSDSRFRGNDICEKIPHDKKERLLASEEEFKNCQLCALSKTRTQVVFGKGDPNASLMFVGEAPGFDEDRQGEPFVGLAGQLLTKIILAMKLKREDVYIANCLKCRPPQNRNPLPTEIVACKPILLSQVEIIRPKVICALGKFAAQTLLQTDEPISRLRGRFFDWHGIKLMPTFHPAYLLRNPLDKKYVWEDMQKIMKELNP